MFHNFYSENRDVCGIMWKKYCRVRQATDENIMQDNSDTNMHSEYVIQKYYIF